MAGSMLIREGDKIVCMGITVVVSEIETINFSFKRGVIYRFNTKYY